MSQQKVDRFAQGVEIAQSSGLDVRFEYLHGTGGGLCQLKAKACLFVDLALDVEEQLERLEKALSVAIGERWQVQNTNRIQQWLGQ